MVSISSLAVTIAVTLPEHQKRQRIEAISIRDRIRERDDLSTINTFKSSRPINIRTLNFLFAEGYSRHPARYKAALLTTVNNARCYTRCIKTDRFSPRIGESYYAPNRFNFARLIGLCRGRLRSRNSSQIRPKPFSLPPTFFVAEFDAELE